ncbi:TonB-dependent receptor [Aureispira anguillae]|uniref:TonB-dependent receptor n=1 Tax=Aureispira anguillae TaxID=2864201 RepID=A0A915YEQ5_9BACT|nr:TonB-dependent receptor [Aureispira anguillae]BDS11768.1 TonB-dependent receptor [Aureispira anguillae]
MKIFCSIILIFFSYSFVFGWTEINGGIRGIVTNAESGQVIRGATIKLVPFEGNGKEKRSFSKDAGEFIFTDIKPGVYNLECTAFGFKTTRIIGIQVREDRTKLAYFKLSRGYAAEVTNIYSYAALAAKQKTAIETGASTTESIENTPATVYVVTAEEIEQQGYMGINELLRDIPEIEIQDRYASQDYNSVSARGVHGNEKVLILIDGIRYSSMVNSKYALLENYNIRYAERVEIILGPASALYGADAYMGVINIITKEGKKGEQFSLTGSYGMNHTTSNAFQFGVGNDDVSFSMSGGFYYSEGAKLNDYYLDEFRFYNKKYLQDGAILNSPVDQEGNMQTLPIKPFDMSRFAYFVEGKLEFKKWKIGIFHNQEQHSSAVSTKSHYSPYWAESRFGSSLTGLNIEHVFLPKRSSKWTLKSVLNGTLMFTPTNSKYINAFSNYKDAYSIGSDFGVRLTETFNYKISKRHKLAFGMTMQHSITLPKSDDVPHQNNNPFLPFSMANTPDYDIYYLGTDYTDLDGNSLKIYQDFYYIRRIILGAFAEYRLNLNKKFLLTLGLRFDQIIDISEYSPNKEARAYNTLNPRLGLIYKPFNNFNIKLFYGEGFLQPAPEQKYEHFGTFFPVQDAAGNNTHITGGFWHVPNEDLLPEKVRTTEFSGKYGKGDFSIGLNTYFNLIENAIVSRTNYEKPMFVGIPATATEQSVNSDIPTITYGTTLRADYRLVFGQEEQVQLKIHASYSYADGKMEGLEYLPFTAKHTLKAGLLFQWKSFSISNNILYRSASYNNGSIDIDGELIQAGNPAFVVWNLFAKYSFAKQKKAKVNLFVKVNNVLNNQYYHTTDNSTISLGASPQDPIRFIGGFTVDFGG